MCVILCTNHTRCGHQDAQLIRCQPTRACVLPGAVSREFNNSCSMECQTQHARSSVFRSLGLPESDEFNLEVEVEISNAMPSEQELFRLYRHKEEIVLASIPPQQLWEVDIRKIQNICRALTFDSEGNIREPDESQDEVARRENIHRALILLPPRLFVNLSDADRVSFYGFVFDLFNVYLIGTLRGEYRSRPTGLNPARSTFQCFHMNWYETRHRINIAKAFPLTPAQRQELDSLELLLLGFYAQFLPIENDIQTRQRRGQPRQYVNPIDRQADADGVSWLSASNALEVARAFYLSASYRIWGDDYLNLRHFDPSTSVLSSEDYMTDFARIEAFGLLNFNLWMPEPQDIEAVRPVYFDPSGTPREFEAVRVPADMANWNFGRHVEESREQAAEQARRDAVVNDVRQARFDALTEALDVSELDASEQPCHICREEFGEGDVVETPRWLSEESTCPICRRDYRAALDPANHGEFDDEWSDVGGELSVFDEELLLGLALMQVNEDNDDQHSGVLSESTDEELLLRVEPTVAPTPAVHEIHEDSDNHYSGSEVGESTDEERLERNFVS